MSSILVEEVGCGAATVISAGFNLNNYPQCAVYPAGLNPTDEVSVIVEDVEIPDEPFQSVDVEMEPSINVMEAEDTAQSSETCDMPEIMNQEEASSKDSDEYAVLTENTLEREEPEIENLRVCLENEVINEKLEEILAEECQLNQTDVIGDEVAAQNCSNVNQECVFSDRIPIEKPLFESQTMIEISRHSWGTREPNYLRGCVWSPDGTCILAPVHRDGMHVLELPTDMYAVDQVSASRPLDILTSAVHVPENGMVYDCCWYPFMSSAAPETCCWISTQQHGPIQMWDAFDGKLRCSYRGYDAVDEVNYYD